MDGDDPLQIRSRRIHSVVSTYLRGRVEVQAQEKYLHYVRAYIVHVYVSEAKDPYGVKVVLLCIIHA